MGFMDPLWEKMRREIEDRIAQEIMKRIASELDRTIMAFSYYDINSISDIPTQIGNN